MSDTPAVPSPSSEGGGSLLERIKTRREERLKHRHLDLPVPGWGGDLVARFHPLDRDTLKKIAAKSDNEQHGDADLLIAACDGLHMKEEDGGLQPLNSAFDEETADKLGVPFSSARELVYYLCDTDLSVAVMSSKVLNWSADTSQEVDGQVLGEA